MLGLRRNHLAQSSSPLVPRSLPSLRKLRSEEVWFIMTTQSLFKVNVIYNQKKKKILLFT